MTDLVTSAQMRAIERTAIESGAVTGLALMERAGEGVVDALLAEWPEFRDAPGRAVILCGPGNNGGDGYVIARLLSERGWTPTVFHFGDPARLPPDASANYEAWRVRGDVTVRPIEPRTCGDEDLKLPGHDVLIDAVFGTGIARPFRGPLALSVQGQAQLRRDGVRVVAVDVPSGLCADSGRVLGAAIRADLTVAFHRLKPGHVLAEGPALCGRVVLADIGLNGDDRTVPGQAIAVIESPCADLGKSSGHKYSHGHALVLTGAMGRSGAARLAARGALRVGAGLVTLGAPGSAMMECAAQITALMLRRVEDGAALVTVLQDRRINALSLGPGMGVERAAEALSALRDGGVEPRPTVVDADALTALGRVQAPLPRDWVLTPHGGEFARLFPDLAAKLAAPAVTGPACSKVDAAREAAARAGCVVLCKGPDTVVAAPDGRAAVHAASGARAAPWLATAGAGDVLAGIIAGLMARGIAPFQAACAGAWLHVEAARAFGPGLIAEDLPEALPGVLKRLLEGGR